MLERNNIDCNIAVTEGATDTPVKTMDAKSKAEHIMEQIVALIIVLTFFGKKKGRRCSIRGLWQSLSSHPMPKQIGTMLRKRLEALGLIGGANGSISMFEEIEQYAGLIEYAVFSSDSYEVPELDESILNAHELKLYSEARALSEALPSESKMEKYLKKLGLQEPELGLYGQFITIKGNELIDLEDRTLEIPEVTEHLPEGACLIKHRNTAYIYVTTPRMLDLSLQSIGKMDIDITPVFYKTFDGGIGTNQSAFPSSEDL